MATYKDFKNIPEASQPVKQPIGKQDEAIDKYIAENIKDPTIADAAKQSYTAQTVQQNELQDIVIQEIKLKANNPLAN